jgi:hypothetical protein
MASIISERKHRAIATEFEIIISVISIRYFSNTDLTQKANTVFCFLYQSGSRSTTVA